MTPPDHQSERFREPYDPTVEYPPDRQLRTPSVAEPPGRPPGGDGEPVRVVEAEPPDRPTREVTVSPFAQARVYCPAAQGEHVGEKLAAVFV